MANPVFPPAGVTTPQDTQYYSAGNPEDPTIRGEMEGGYTVTRPRFTKKPRRTFMTGWSILTQTQVDALNTFWDTNGGWNIVDWTDPVTSTVKSVRFTKPFEIEYIGIGPTKLYRVSVEMKEV